MQKMLKNSTLTELSHVLVEIVDFVTFRHHLFDRAFDRFRDLIDVLRLDDGFQVVLEDFREVVLQLGAAEEHQNVLPIGRVLNKQTKQY